LLDVRALPEPHGRHEVLRHGDRLRVCALRAFLALLFVVFVCFGGSRQDENANAGRVELRMQDLEALFRLLVPRRRLQQRQEYEPIARRHCGVDLLRPEAGAPIERQQVAETRVIVEIQPESRGVHKYEFARGADLELPFRGDDLATHRRELRERALNRRILDRVELDGAQRGVVGIDQASPSAPNVRVTSVRVAGASREVALRRRRERTRRRHVIAPRSARFTAFLTTTSFSDDDLRRTSIALGLEIRPSAIAAHARNSESSRRPRNPFPFSTESRYSTPPSPESVPKASKNAIFSVRSASRIVLPFTTASTRGRTSLYWRVVKARTAEIRTSRSESSTPRSRACNALGDPISVMA